MITNQSKKYVASVMDYIAVTGLSLRSFILTYDHYKFKGKGIGRVRINVI